MLDDRESHKNCSDNISVNKFILSLLTAGRRATINLFRNMTADQFDFVYSFLTFSIRVPTGRATLMML